MSKSRQHMNPMCEPQHNHGGAWDMCSFSLSDKADAPSFLHFQGLRVQKGGMDLMSHFHHSIPMGSVYLLHF